MLDGKIRAADIRPGMVVEVTIKARVTEIEQSWHGPVKLYLLDGTAIAGGQPLRHEVTLLPEDRAVLHEL